MCARSGTGGPTSAALAEALGSRGDPEGSLFEAVIGIFMSAVSIIGSVSMSRGCSIRSGCRFEITSESLDPLARRREPPLRPLPRMLPSARARSARTALARSDWSACVLTAASTIRAALDASPLRPCSSARESAPAALGCVSAQIGGANLFVSQQFGIRSFDR